MTPAQLRAKVMAREDSKFFTHANMRFSGDTMRNYGVRGPVTLKRYSGDIVQCWELYRKKPVKHGARGSAYFHVDTFEKCSGELLPNN